MAAHYLWRRTKLIAMALIATTAASPALSQSMQAPPIPIPQYSARTPAGVNLSTAAVTISNTDITVGTGDFPSKISLTRTYHAGGGNGIPSFSRFVYSDLGTNSYNSLLVYFTCGSCGGPLQDPSTRHMVQVTVSAFGKTYHFNDMGTSGFNIKLFSYDDDGSTMTVVNPTQNYWTYNLITHDGVKIVFSDNPTYYYDGAGGRNAEYAEFPDGHFLAFTYENAFSTTSALANRLKSVVNDRGYGLNFFYVNPATGGSTIDLYRISIDHISAFRTGCVSTPSIICGVGELPSIYYTYTSLPGGLYLSSYKDADGNLMQYSYDNIYNRLISIIKPNNPSQSTMQFSYTQGQDGDDIPYSMITGITDFAGNSTKYNFTVPGDGTCRSVVIVNPDNSTDTYTTYDLCYSKGFGPAPYLDYTPLQHIDG